MFHGLAACAIFWLVLFPVRDELGRTGTIVAAAIWIVLFVVCLFAGYPYSTISFLIMVVVDVILILFALSKGIRIE